MNRILSFKDAFNKRTEGLGWDTSFDMMEDGSVRLGIGTIPERYVHHYVTLVEIDQAYDHASCIQVLVEQTVTLLLFLLT